MTRPATISPDPAVQAHYELCLKNGCAPRLAEMLAFRSPQRVLTDREYFEGRGTLAKQFDGDERVLEHVVGEAMKQGYRPNANDVYCSAIAESVGDPKAFVPATGGRGHIQKVLEERGWESDGIVKTKRRELVEAQQPVPLGHDLVVKNAIKMLTKDPDLARRASKREIKEEVIHRHGAKK